VCHVTQGRCPISPIPCGRSSPYIRSQLTHLDHMGATTMNKRIGAAVAACGLAIAGPATCWANTGGDAVKDSTAREVSR
jgi:hypothetical protein